MSVKVKRKVDTVIVEMDIAVAEQLSEILFLVNDRTRMVEHYGSSINDLRVMLVRFPSPLYKAEAYNGYVELTDAR